MSWQRTLIPSQLDGVARDIVIFEVDQPGVDDWVSLRINDQEIVTGNGALTCLRDGSTARKESWSRVVNVNGKVCTLPIPRQALTDVAVPFLLVGGLVAIWVLRSRTGKGSGVHSA